MPNQITYARHEMDPVLIRGNEAALIFIHNHWQGMCSSLAGEAKLMTEEEFYSAFGKIADHVLSNAGP